MTFITYSLSGHSLNASKIFTALQFFNVLQNPISFLPQILAALTDALSAIRKYDCCKTTRLYVSRLRQVSRSYWCIPPSERGIECYAADWESRAFELH